MKKIILFLTLISLGSKLLSQGSYNIQLEKHLLIVLTDDNNENINVVNKVLSDTLSHNCTSLNLAGNFTSLPGNIYTLSSIDDMMINSSKPVILDSGFSGFKNLNGLEIYSEIISIDRNIRLDSLEYLTLHYTRFRSIPKAIFTWKNLLCLEIDTGLYSVIPREISNLTKLEILILANNKIQSVPDELYSLDKLKVLNLESTRLITLSSKVCEMKSLEEIYLDGNKRLVLSDKIKGCLSEKIRTLY